MPKIIVQSSIDKCVFIISDIGCYFGEKTELKSLDMSLNFNSYFSLNPDIYVSLNQLLTTIKNNIKKVPINLQLYLLLSCYCCRIISNYNIFMC